MVCLSHKMSEEITACIKQSAFECIVGVGSKQCSGKFMVMMVMSGNQGGMWLVRSDSFR